jgi:uncharacterized protein YrrD
MQNMEVTKKWLNLRGIALVTIEGGNKEGTLEDFYFDPQTSAIRALRVKTGVFGHRALLTSSINAIGTDAITFTNEEALIDEKSDAHLPTMPFGSELLNYKVLTEGGTVVGSVSDIILDVSNPTQMHIASYELPGNLLGRLGGHRPMFAANQVIRYGRDVIIIPDAVAETLK